MNTGILSLVLALVLLTLRTDAGQYPDELFTGRWVNYETPLNAETLNLRDDEIRAVERSLGLRLVPQGESLSKFLWVDPQSHSLTFREGGYFNATWSNPHQGSGVSNVFGGSAEGSWMRLSGDLRFQQYLPYRGELKGFLSSYLLYASSIEDNEGVYPPQFVAGPQSRTMGFRFGSERLAAGESLGVLISPRRNNSADPQRTFPSEVMTFHSNGNIGIGTTEPESKVHTVSQANGNLRREVRGGDNASLERIAYHRGGLELGIMPVTFVKIDFGTEPLRTTATGSITITYSCQHGESGAVSGVLLYNWFMVNGKIKLSKGRRLGEVRTDVLPPFLHFDSHARHGTSEVIELRVKSNHAGDIFHSVVEFVSPQIANVVLSDS